MKNKFRTYVSCALYVAAVVAFLTAIITTGPKGGVVIFSDLARFIYCALAVICVVIATLVWKTEKSCGKRKKVLIIVAAVACIVVGGYIDDYLEHNTGTRELTADLYKISQATAAKFETADGRWVMVEDEIELLASLAEHEIHPAPMTPADSPEDWIYRITYDVPDGEEVVVYVHEKYLNIGPEFYLPDGNADFDGILGWFNVTEEYLFDSAEIAEPKTPVTDPEVEVRPVSAYLLSQAEYPEMAPYPDMMEYVDEKSGAFDDDAFNDAYEAWWTDQRTRNPEEGYADDLNGFFEKSIPQFLSGDGSENRVYSPLNVYMALGMLAELTDGNSRQQILDLLGIEDIETLRTQAAALWKANYNDDGATTTVLASSLWLNEDINFLQSTLDTLADTYYASSYQGQMGSDEFNKALQGWLNEQTDGLLEEQTAQIEMDAETLMALATTICFRAKWSNEFNENWTEEKVFHTPDGDVACDFMHQGGTDTYYWGDQFSAVGKWFEGRGAMWFVLPDEGVTTEELLNDSQAMEFLLHNEEWENSKCLIVNKAIPKFDVVSQLDLCDGLKALGITDVFDYERSDFTPMTKDTDEVYLSRVKHDARVTIDEDGCTAVAYTVMMAAGAGRPPEEEVDFVLDRPFLFAITGYDGLPLFVGVVNQPVAK